MCKTLIVIPAFNCESTIGPLIADIKYNAQDCPILVVDDGSTDKTEDVLRVSSVFFIKHPENFGKGMALKSAIKWAQEKDYEYIITMDADGQHSPSDLNAFMNSKSDLSIGCRTFKLGIMPPARIISNSLSSVLLSFRCKQTIKDSQCGYRKIKLDIINDFLPSSNGYQFETEMILHILMIRNGSIENIPVETIYDGQKSNIRHFRDTIEYFKALVNYSKKEKNV